MLAAVRIQFQQIASHVAIGRLSIARILVHLRIHTMEHDTLAMGTQAVRWTCCS